MAITVPKHLEKIKAYVPGKPISEVQAQYGITSPVKLASNENPLGPSPKALDAIRQALSHIHLYPDSHYRKLRQRLAEILGVSPEQIIVGNGSDEIMALIGQALLLPGEEVIAPHPAFSIYEKVAILAQAEFKKIPLKDMAIDLEGILKAVSAKTKLIFLTNPHNPTGSFFDVFALNAFLNTLPSSVLVVLDEAYIDFVSKERQFNSVEQLSKFPNLIILRTFSKTYGLAGLRIGYGVFAKELVGFIEKVRMPFNVNLLAQAAAAAALEDREFLKKTQATIWAGRKFLTKELTALGVKVYPSEANFILIEVGKKATRIYEELLKKGVYAKETHKSIMRIAPALTIEAWQIDNIAEAIRNVIKEL